MPLTGQIIPGQRGSPHSTGWWSWAAWAAHVGSQEEKNPRSSIHNLPPLPKLCPREGARGSLRLLWAPPSYCYLPSCLLISVIAGQHDMVSLSLEAGCNAMCR